MSEWCYGYIYGVITTGAIMGVISTIVNIIRSMEE